MILYKKNLFHLLDSILKMKFLTLEQKQFYKENGFIKLDNIFNFEEINQISEDYDDLFQVVPICILADRANISTNLKNELSCFADERCRKCQCKSNLER